MPDRAKRNVSHRVFTFTVSLKNAEEAAAAAANLWEQARAFLAANGIGKTGLYSVRMWLEELLTNSAKYGIPAGEVSVTAEGRIECGEGGELYLTFSDNGTPFDPSTAAGPDLKATAEERSIGGLGLQLLFERFSGFSYRREEGRNRGEWLLDAAETTEEGRP